MSIITTVFVPEGIAMAADSRITLSIPNGNGITERFTLTDNAQKLFALNKIKIGISSCGNTIIDNKTVADFIRIFEIEKLEVTDNIITATEKLAEHIKSFGIESGVIFQVCGYFNEVPYVYRIINGEVYRQNINQENVIVHNVIWNGELDAIANLLLGPNPSLIVYDIMPLKDAIDLAEFLVDITIKYQRFQSKLATCGGPIDSLVITKDYLHFFKHKILNP